MSEATLTNAKQSGDNLMAESEYRELCRKLRQEQIIRSKQGLTKRKKNSTVLAPKGNLKEITLNVRIEESPTNWADIKNDTVFALDPNGTQLFTKKGKDKAANLRTNKSMSIAGAAVYIVYL